MAENSSKSEELTLQDVQAQVDGLQNDMKTMHERLDSTVTSSNERFDQLDLADTAARTTLATIMTRLEAMSTQLGTMMIGVECPIFRRVEITSIWWMSTLTIRLRRASRSANAIAEPTSGGY